MKKSKLTTKEAQALREAGLINKQRFAEFMRIPFWAMTITSEKDRGLAIEFLNEAIDFFECVSEEIHSENLRRIERKDFDKVSLLSRQYDNQFMKVMIASRLRNALLPFRFRPNNDLITLCRDN